MQSRLMVNLSERQIELKYIAAGTILASLLLTVSTNPMFTVIESEMLTVLEAALGLGLIGLFSIAFFSNIVVIVNIPFMLIALPWVVADASLSGILLFSAATGIGAGLGKLMAYALTSRAMARFRALHDSPLHARVSTQIERHPRFAPAWVFLAAGTVLPLDPALMPLLLVKYPTHKIAVPLVMGKILQSMTLAYAMVFMSASLGIGESMHVDLTLGVVLGALLLMAYQIEKVRRPVLAAQPSESSGAGLEC